MTPAERLALVREALDVREEKAQACVSEVDSGVWREDTDDGIYDALRFRHVAAGPWSGGIEDGPRRHIIAHDPVTVLREVAAGRTLCDEWEAHLKEWSRTLHLARHCAACRLFTTWSDVLLLDRL